MHNMNHIFCLVTFGPNSGSVLPASETSDKNVFLPTPTRDGYTCLGWSKDSKATEAAYFCGAEYKPKSNITFYAVWEKVQHSHTLSHIVVPATCTEKGYTEYTCSVCPHSYKDNYVNPVGHTWVEWTRTTEFTIDAECVDTRECSTCH